MAGVDISNTLSRNLLTPSYMKSQEKANPYYGNNLTFRILR